MKGRGLCPICCAYPCTEIHHPADLADTAGWVCFDVEPEDDQCDQCGEPFAPNTVVYVQDPDLNDYDSEYTICPACWHNG